MAAKNRTWEDKVRKVVPYVAGEQPKDANIIKLNTNENPYPPSEKVREAMEQLAEEADLLRLYPDMDATALVDALAQYLHVDSSRIFVGVGSDDVLALSFMTFFCGGGTLLFPDITYSFYKVWASLYRIPYRTVPLTQDMRIDPAAFKAGPEDGELAGIILPNPNAPTGVEAPQADIEAILQANPACVVIVDEAYVDFGAESALPLLEKYDNLLIVQTFSKSRSMAGLRIGYAVGNEKLIGFLKDVKFSFNSYTLGRPSILMGTASVKDEVYFRETTEKIAKTREWFSGELDRLGFVHPQSRANFVFAKHPAHTGEELLQKLRANGILVRHFAQPGISDYLRITIGRPEQMKEVVRVLEEIL
ncbi:MAG: histidinol-phosphate transaminase [Lachnospiraceae bacterium]|nr:histidinol-phosphate transaminase [Lachnospiraceae bacterium]